MGIKNYLSNGLLVLVLLIGQAPVLFKNISGKYNAWLLIEKESTAYWIAHFYSEVINFAIMAGLLFLGKHLDKRLIRIVFIVTLLDVVHMALVRKMVFSDIKLMAAVLISLTIEFYYYYKSTTLK